MQISEELVKQITNAVLSQMSQSGVSSSTGDHITAPSSGKSLSLAGRERINDEKTSYASYPRAKKGTDPKERAYQRHAFQRQPDQSGDHR